MEVQEINNNKIPEQNGQKAEQNDQKAEQEAKSLLERDVLAEAKEKLDKDLNSVRNKHFSKQVIAYLLDRCADDAGLAEDILQEHKSLIKCDNYITDKAKKAVSGAYGIVDDSVVYEWAEDYYRKDDKAEEEEKAKKKAEKKANVTKRALEKIPKKPAPKPEPKAEPKPKPKKNNDVDGQMDLFTFMAEMEKQEADE